MYQRHQQGFNLVEMLVVMGVMGVLMAMAYPHFLEMMRASESRRVALLFEQALRDARAQSYINKQDVMICTLDASGACRREGSQVLTIFYDKNRNNRKDAQDEIIYQSAWKVKHGTMLLNTSLHRHYIRYMGDTAKPRGHIGHLRYCSVSENPSLSFKVVVNMYGQVRVERGDLVEVGC